MKAPGKQVTDASGEDLLRVFHYQNRRLLNVFIDRSIWFMKGLEALAADDLAAIRRFNPGLPPGAGEQEMRCAYTYASAVFCVSAFESFLLTSYHNHVAVWYAWKKTYPPNFDAWLKKRGGDPATGLKSLSFSSFTQADDWFSDIFGAACFKQALPDEEAYKKLKTAFEDLSDKRNGILHRGGEKKHGEFITITHEELSLARKALESFGAKLSDWSLNWWLARKEEDSTFSQALDRMARNDPPTEA